VGAHVAISSSDVDLKQNRYLYNGQNKHLTLQPERKQVEAALVWDANKFKANVHRQQLS